MPLVTIPTLETIHYIIQYLHIHYPAYLVPCVCIIMCTYTCVFTMSCRLYMYSLTRIVDLPLPVHCTGNQMY